MDTNRPTKPGWYEWRKGEDEGPSWSPRKVSFWYKVDQSNTLYVMQSPDCGKPIHLYGGEWGEPCEEPEDWDKWFQGQEGKHRERSTKLKVKR